LQSVRVHVPLREVGDVSGVQARSQRERKGLKPPTDTVNPLISNQYLFNKVFKNMLKATPVTA